jgi:outer membrane murein-binding lipoprotein Lpp
MKKVVVAVLSMSIILSGCATASKDIVPTYTSPMQFQAYNCDQLASETQRIQGRVTQLGGRLDTAASNDKAIAGVGIVLFWPALFALGGTKQQEADYARLKGEYDAVQQSAILRKCPGIVG